MSRRTLYERWATKWEVDESTGCWPWTAMHDENGYGRIYVDERHRCSGAHRVGYELLVGPVPDGLVLDHLCENPACVNPDHLEPVTNATNVIRGPHAREQSARTHCRNGHPYPENPKIKNGGRICNVCERDYQRSRVIRLPCSGCGGLRTEKSKTGLCRKCSGKRLRRLQLIALAGP